MYAIKMKFDESLSDWRLGTVQLKKKTALELSNFQADNESEILLFVNQGDLTPLIYVQYFRNKCQTGRRNKL